MGNFDTNLVELVTSDAISTTKFSLKFKTHEMVGGKQMKIMTYKSGNKCDLDDVNTLSCKQLFSVYAQSYTGIVAKAARLTITFKSECVDIATDYLALTQVAKATWWSWEATKKQ